MITFTHVLPFTDVGSSAPSSQNSLWAATIASHGVEPGPPLKGGLQFVAGQGVQEASHFWTSSVALVTNSFLLLVAMHLFLLATNGFLLLLVRHLLLEAMHLFLTYSKDGSPHDEPSELHLPCNRAMWKHWNGRNDRLPVAGFDLSRKA